MSQVQMSIDGYIAGPSGEMVRLTFGWDDDLKQGDIITYGGGAFVASLLKHSLTDELHLFVNPVALGKGMPIFAELEDK